MRTGIVTLVIGLSFTVSTFAQTVMTNENVRNLLESSFPESTIIQIINSPDVTRKFDTSVDQLIELKEAGAGERLILEVLGKDKTPTDLYAEQYNKLFGGILFDTPERCTPLKPFSDVEKNNMASYFHLAYDDIMSGQGTLEEKLESFRRYSVISFLKFGSLRRSDYENVRCHYFGQDWNKPGNSSTSTIKLQPGFVWDGNELDRTRNGDWKNGPDWRDGYTVMHWTTGGHSKSYTYVRVVAKYIPAYYKRRITDEMNSVRALLHQHNIPTELPDEWNN